MPGRQLVAKATRVRNCLTFKSSLILINSFSPSIKQTAWTYVVVLAVKFQDNSHLF